MIVLERFWRHFVRRWVRCGLLGLAVSTGSLSSGFAATNSVNIVDPYYFSPANLSINLNDTVTWIWTGVYFHSSTATGLWDSGTHNTTGYVFSRQFTCAGNFPYF